MVSLAVRPDETQVEKLDKFSKAFSCWGWDNVTTTRSWTKGWSFMRTACSPSACSFGISNQWTEGQIECGLRFNIPSIFNNLRFEKLWTLDSTGMLITAGFGLALMIMSLDTDFLVFQLRLLERPPTIICLLLL